MLILRLCRPASNSTDDRCRHATDVRRARHRRVLSEYCLRLEINAFDEWLDLFTDDAIYEVHRRVLTGRAEISAMLSQAPHGVHLPGATRITLDGDQAEVIQSYLFIANSNDSWNSGWYRPHFGAHRRWLEDFPHGGENGAVWRSVTERESQ